ncbi:MAG: Flp pilus assembly protein CpaB [Desulfobacterium sp.]|nr:Flp pilus assembly protein CpaB [Desulfobacterium sp.]MBU3947288.1 Flp pilus assembly protein CpaB [Pseudomonadota bacterium]MBU4036743.1 Flp pilus assembly protein CpaB [Pseudomonadota bacterium]
MGKSKPFVILIVAVIIAFITSILIYKNLQKKDRSAASVPTQAVTVAVIDLSWGTAITKDMVKTVAYLKDNLPQGTFSDPALLINRVLIYPVRANEPIYESRLAPVSINTGGVAAVISPNKRAVAVKVDQVIGVSGFIQPGNRVDVLVTIASDRGSSSDLVTTKIVLEKILVLAAGQEVEKQGKIQNNVNVITLEVDPEEAEKLTLAATEGKLQLALRNFSDTEDVFTRGTTVPILLGSYRDENEIKLPVKQAGIKRERIYKRPGLQKTPPFRVEVIKGGKVSEVKFEREGGI